MAFVNRCIFLPTAGGTGTWTVASAKSGYLTPAQAGAVDATVYRYTAELRDGSGTILAWEVGSSTYTVAGTTATRTVLLSSNANAVVNFASPPEIMLCVLAEDLFAPTANDATALGSATKQFADLYLAAGGNINWENGLVTLSQGAGTGLLAFSTTTTGHMISFLNFDAGDLGCSLQFYHGSPSPLAGDTVAQFYFTGLDNAAGFVVYSFFRVNIISTTAGATSASWTLGVADGAGGFTTSLALSPASAVFSGCTVTGNDATAILKSGTTITGGSTANVPTLTSGPVTGNPTKWLPFNDNGTVRYIPSW